MTVFDERSRVPVSRWKLRLMALPVLALLVWGGVTFSHQPRSLRQTLREFRGEVPGEVPADARSSRSMDSSLAVRRFLLTRPSPKLSAIQSAALVASVAGPTDEQAQSEALDVLSLAQRAHALSPPQSHQAGLAALSVLQHSPGPMVRLESARLLGHLGDQAGRPALIVLQQDSDPKVRKAAGEALTRVQK